LCATNLELRNLSPATLADPTSALPHASAATLNPDPTERILLRFDCKNVSTTKMRKVNLFDHDRSRESPNHGPTPRTALKKPSSPSTAPPNSHDDTAEQRESTHGPDNATNRTPTAPPPDALSRDENHEAKEEAAAGEAGESCHALEQEYKGEPALSCAHET
jgi:hypothetical protein